MKLLSMSGFIPEQICDCGISASVCLHDPNHDRLKEGTVILVAGDRIQQLYFCIHTWILYFKRKVLQAQDSWLVCDFCGNSDIFAVIKKERNDEDAFIHCHSVL